MTGHASLIARALLGVASASACCALISSRKLLEMSAARFNRIVNWSMVGSRLGVYTLLYFVARLHARGDILGAYTPEAFSTYNGLLVYRDFPSSYAPLHTYLDAMLLRVWPSPLCLILFAVCMELLLLPVWLRAGRTFLKERDVRLASLFYLASPLSLQFVAVDGQDNVAVALLLALAVWYLVTSRAVVSGLLVSLSICVFKFLPLLFVPSFFLAAAKTRWKWLFAFAVPVLLTYGLFQWAGASVLAPLGREGVLRKAGCLPYVIETLVGRYLPARLWDGLVAVALLGTVLLVVWLMYRAGESHRVHILFFSMPCFLLALVLLAKKSWPPYLMLVLFPLSLMVAKLAPWKRITFIAFSFLALMEHSFWSINLHEVNAPQLHRMLTQHNGMALLLFAIEVLLISGYVWLWVEATLRLVRTSLLTDEDRDSSRTFVTTRTATLASLDAGSVTRRQACA